MPFKIFISTYDLQNTYFLQEKKKNLLCYWILSRQKSALMN
jgi:hypothetical protein